MHGICPVHDIKGRISDSVKYETIACYVGVGYKLQAGWSFAMNIVQRQCENAAGLYIITAAIHVLER